MNHILTPHSDRNAPRLVRRPVIARRFKAGTIMLAAALTSGFAAGTAHAAFLFHEGFETDGSPSRYTLRNEFYTDNGSPTDNADDRYFTETVVIANTLSAEDAFTAKTGSEFFAGSTIVVGANPNNPGRIDFDTNLSDTNTPGLRVTVSLAATQAVWEASTIDHISILADMDGDGAFETALGNTTVDGNDNFVIDSTVLDTTFQDVSFVIPGGVTDLGIRIEADSASTNELIGIDNIRVSVIPEPASLALLGAGGMMMLGRRRRRA